MVSKYATLRCLVALTLDKSLIRQDAYNYYCHMIHINGLVLFPLRRALKSLGYIQ